MHRIREFVRKAWIDTFAMVKAGAILGVILGLGKFPIEHFFGRFSPLSMGLAHLTYVLIKHGSARVYGFMGDAVDHYFPPCSTKKSMRVLVHGIALSAHIIPIYIVNALCWGIHFDQLIPGILWYAVSNMATGLWTRNRILLERERRGLKTPRER